VDLALIAVTGSGSATSASLLGGLVAPLDRLRADLNRHLRGLPTVPGITVRAARALGERCADAAAELLAAHGGVSLDMIAAQGLPAWHDAHERLLWELLDPWPLAQRFRVPVVHDLAQADLMAGGHGRPIFPVADRLLFPRGDRARLIVHLHALCSVTFLPTEGRRAAEGFDLGPAMLLLDAAVRELYPDRVMDKDGRMAQRGAPSEALFPLLMAHPFFKDCPNRALGRGEFDDAWVSHFLEEARRWVRGDDLLASVVEALAMMIRPLAQRLHYPQIVLTGGGARHPLLVERVRARCAPSSVLIASELGIPEALHQAMAVALLGALAHDGVPLSPHEAGLRHRPVVAGLWTGRV
jgi:1,6-anhydro-N-acetylmuramate kinase